MILDLFDEIEEGVGGNTVLVDSITQLKRIVFERDAELCIQAISKALVTGKTEWVPDGLAYLAVSASLIKVDPDMVNVFDVDKAHFFGLAEEFVKESQWGAILDMVEMASALFSEQKSACGWPLNKCNGKRDSGGACGYTWIGDEFICPRCGTGRRLCNIRRISGGRCKDHGEKGLIVRASNKLTGRAKTLLAALPDSEQREMFSNLTNDPEYLSMGDQIGLLGVLQAREVSALGQFNLAEVDQKIRRAINTAVRALNQADLITATGALKDIIAIVDGESEQRRRIGDIIHIANTMARLSKTQQDMIKDSGKFVTREQVEMIQESNANALIGSTRQMAERIASLVGGGIEPHVIERIVRSELQAVIHGVS